MFGCLGSPGPQDPSGLQCWLWARGGNPSVPSISMILGTTLLPFLQPCHLKRLGQGVPGWGVTMPQFERPCHKPKARAPNRLY